MYHSLSDFAEKYKKEEVKKTRNTERGDLLQYFVQKINASSNRGKPATIPYIAMRLKGFGEKDLYYLKSVCDAAEREKGTPWAKVFYGSIKVDK